MFAHATVLLAETIEALAIRDHGVYVDGTLGGAGHANAILEALPTTRLLGIDRDPMALAAARERLAPYGDRVRLVHAEYSEIPRLVTEPVQGILLDLGVSSPQLDVAERGFSFSREGPLDMRMDPTRGPTARELMEDTDADALADILSELGEERYAKRIARMIKDELRVGGLTTTLQLAALCMRAIPSAEQRKSKIHAATRTFQALRIAVNAELENLETLLAAFPDVIAPGGRCAIISFHSLEDRLVKNAFRDLAWSSSLPPRLAVDAGERVEPVVELVPRKAIVASDAEIATNPRARSARLRVCERTAAPNQRALRDPVPRRR